MREKKVGFRYKNKNFSLYARECNFFEKFIGLMFTKKERAVALLFNFNSLTRVRIHSFFVFFSFLAVWLDDKNKVIEIRKISPFTLSVRQKEPFRKLVEIPLNKRYSRLASVLRR